MKKRWLAGGLALILIAGLVAWMFVAWRPPLVVGTHAGIERFAMAGASETGEETVVGFDMELARAIAHQAWRPLKIVDLPREELLPALERGEVDLVLAALVRTPELAGRVAVSKPYYRATQVALVRENEEVPVTVEELRGRRIATWVHGEGREMAEEYADEEGLRLTASPRQAFVDLLNSQTDTVLCDEQIVPALQKVFPEAIRCELGLPDIVYVAAVRLDAGELLELVNTTLAKIAEDGRRDEFLETWLLPRY
ncbi:MAG: amino acid ABC transporter substrate-binding protein [Lentisphaerae bacterium]|jgi:polar amino acid transport system substrate-binding protein|nr:amino acid ABC transporter substrate-binding protein [Lentisphaerota bacterium]